MPERVICAAVQWNGHVWHGHRHGHALQAMQDELSWWMARKDMPKGPSTGMIQGFVTTTGRFVDRKEAMRIQLAAGIESVDEGGYRGDELYSEDLYQYSRKDGTLVKPHEDS